MIIAAYIGTIAPMLLLLFVLRHSRPLVSVLCWGMTAHVLVYYLGHILYASLVPVFPESLIYDFLIPFVEELLKCFPLLYFLLTKRRSFTPFIYIYGIAIGIGFGIEENLLYLIELTREVGNPWVYMLIRSFSTCLMHGLTTGLIGFSFTLSRKIKWLAPLLIPSGLILAVGIHGIYNFLITRLTAAAILLILFLYALFTLYMKRAALKMPETKRTDWQKK